MNTQPCFADVTQFNLSKAFTFSKIFSKVELTPSARIIIRHLADYYNPGKKYIFPSIKELAEVSGYSERSVISAIDELNKAGLLFIAKKNHRSNYYFSNKLFELLGFTEPEKNDNERENISNERENISRPYIEQKRRTKEEQKVFKNSFNLNNKQGISYCSANKPLEDLRKAKENRKSPLDMPKKEAIEWYNTLPEILKNSYFAKEVRKKWNITDKNSKTQEAANLEQNESISSKKESLRDTFLLDNKRNVENTKILAIKNNLTTQDRGSV